MSAAVAEAIAAAVRSAGGKGLTLERVEEVAVGADPALATSPLRRTILAEVIDHLVEAGAVRTPAARSQWDRSGTPPLPMWLRPPQGARARQPSSAAAAPADLRPELAGARSLGKLTAAEAEVLDAVNRWLVSGAGPMVVPHRERSLEVFGDEKRLDALRSSRLFSSGVLSFELLGCEWVPPQLPWRRVGPGRVALVVENAATFRSVSRALEVDPGPVGVVVAGGGNAFTRTVAGLGDPQVGPLDRMTYFGDLDAAGLEIPQRAAVEAQRCELPAPEPAFGLYQLLFSHGAEADTAPVSADRAAAAAGWLGDLAPAAEKLLVAGRRLAQEAVGAALLAEHPRAAHR